MIPTTAAAMPISIALYQSNGPSILPSTIGPRESASALQNRIGGCRGPNDGYRDRGRIALGGEPQSARGSCRRGEGDPATAMYSNDALANNFVSHQRERGRLSNVERISRGASPHHGQAGGALTESPARYV